MEDESIELAVPIAAIQALADTVGYSNGIFWSELTN